MKNISKLILYILIFSFCISGCDIIVRDGFGETGDYESITDGERYSETVADEDGTISDPQNSAEHISIHLSENLSVDADVIYPPDTQYMSYVLESVTVQPDAARDIFFPNDKSSYTLSEVEDTNYRLRTENGNEMFIDGDSITFWAEDQEKNIEIMDLLSRYAEANPDKLGNSIEFMSQEEAVSLGKRAITDLGIAFEPILQTSVAMEHDEIIEWQQNLMEDSSYAEWVDIGKTLRLTDLTRDDDSYYLVFTFSYNDIPIYGPGEPSIQYADVVFPPNRAVAEIVITPRGIQYFNVYNAFSVVQVQDNEAILSIDKAITLLKEKNDMVILTDNQKVSSIWLEYIPILKENMTVLMPYWCFSIDAEVMNTSGNTIWMAGANAERFNAFTGEDLTYGG